MGWNGVTGDKHDPVGFGDMVMGLVFWPALIIGFLALVFG